MWVIEQDPPPLPTDSGEKAHIDLLLKPTEDDLKIWPHRFGIKCILSSEFRP